MAQSGNRDSSVLVTLEEGKNDEVPLTIVIENLKILSTEELLEAMIKFETSQKIIGGILSTRSEGDIESDFTDLEVRLGRVKSGRRTFWVRTKLFRKSTLFLDPEAKSQLLLGLQSHLTQFVQG